MIEEALINKEGIKYSLLKLTDCSSLMVSWRLFAMQNFNSLYIPSLMLC